MKQNKLDILLVDDETVVDKSIGMFLRRRGHDVTYTDKSDVALSHIERRDFNLVISDIRMPGMDGIKLLERIKEHSPDAAVILVTGHANLETAIRAVRAGAADFLLKPVDLEALLISIERAVRLRTLSLERNGFRDRALAAEQREEERLFDSNELIGASSQIRRIRKLIEKIAPNDSTILITGESGTGKELAARMVHRLSRRSSEPFVAVNCVAIAPQLVESELFGHEKGAFTGAERRKPGLIELASEGTLFLDEIGDMTPELQGRLLRVIEDRKIRRVGGEREIEVKTRFIAATNRDLERRVKEGSFRQDLYHRLNVLRVELPPLRVRSGDIDLLARFFVRKIGIRARRPNILIAEDAVAAMKAHHFPGNVRELRNMIEQAVLVADSDTLAAQHFPALGAPGASPKKSTLAENEKASIAAALAKSGGNAKIAAKLLGIGYDAMRYKMRKYKIGKDESEVT